MQRHSRKSLRNKNGKIKNEKKIKTAHAEAQAEITAQKKM
jgi:hypothetical protein